MIQNALIFLSVFVGSFVWSQTTPITRPPSNTELTIKIRQDLMNDPRISNIAAGITVENVNGQIVLRGQVPTHSDETDIINRVRTSSGSTNIDDQMTIVTTQLHQ